MKMFDILKEMTFEDPNKILDYFKNNKIVFKVDCDTKDRLYALNPETKRSVTYLVKENEHGWLYLEKEGART